MVSQASFFSLILISLVEKRFIMKFQIILVITFLTGIGGEVNKLQRCEETKMIHFNVFKSIICMASEEQLNDIVCTNMTSFGKCRKDAFREQNGYDLRKVSEMYRGTDVGEDISLFMDIQDRLEGFCTEEMKLQDGIIHEANYCERCTEMMDSYKGFGTIINVTSAEQLNLIFCENMTSYGKCLKDVMRERTGIDLNELEHHYIGTDFGKDMTVFMDMQERLEEFSKQRTELTDGKTDPFERCRKMMNSNSELSLQLKTNRIRVEQLNPIYCENVKSYSKCLESVLKARTGFDLLELANHYTETDFGKDIILFLEIQERVEGVCTDGTKLKALDEVDPYKRCSEIISYEEVRLIMKTTNTEQLKDSLCKNVTSYVKCMNDVTRKWTGLDVKEFIHYTIGTNYNANIAIVARMLDYLEDFCAEDTGPDDDPIEHCSEMVSFIKLDSNTRVTNLEELKHSFCENVTSLFNCLDDVAREKTGFSFEELTHFIEKNSDEDIDRFLNMLEQLKTICGDDTDPPNVIGGETDPYQRCTEMINSNGGFESSIKTTNVQELNVFLCENMTNYGECLKDVLKEQYDTDLNELAYQLKDTDIGKNITAFMNMQEKLRQTCNEGTDLLGSIAGDTNPYARCSQIMNPLKFLSSLKTVKTADQVHLSFCKKMKFFFKCMKGILRKRTESDMKHLADPYRGTNLDENMRMFIDMQERFADVCTDVTGLDYDELDMGAVPSESHTEIWKNKDGFESVQSMTSEELLNDMCGKMPFLNRQLTDILGKETDFDLNKLVDRHRGTDFGTGFTILSNTKKLLQEICTEGSELREDLLDSALCFRGMPFNTINDCYQNFTDVYSTFKASVKWNLEAERCILASFLVCISHDVKEQCGEKGFETFQKVIMKTGIFESGLCNSKTLEDIKHLNITEDQESNEVIPHPYTTFIKTWLNTTDMTSEETLNLLCEQRISSEEWVNSMTKNITGFPLKFVEDYYRGTDVGNAIAFERKSLEFIEDICTDGNELRDRVLENLPCYKEMPYIGLKACFEQARDAYSVFRKLQDEAGVRRTKFEERCIKELYEYGCFTAEFKTHCGEPGFETFKEIVKKIGFLKSGICSPEILNYFKNSLLDRLEITEDQKKSYLAILNL